jgi:hypothetical protein
MSRFYGLLQNEEEKTMVSVSAMLKMFDELGQKISKKKQLFPSLAIMFWLRRYHTKQYLRRETEKF